MAYIRVSMSIADLGVVIVVAFAAGVLAALAWRWFR